jgi:hypothetical protein
LGGTTADSQRQLHEYVRNGAPLTSLLSLFHPASGQAHLTAAPHTTNKLHASPEQELTAIPC